MNTEFTVEFQIDGFAISARFEGDCAKLRAVIEGIKQTGGSPVAASPSPTKADTCPHHPGRKLKASTARPGSFYCTAKDAETGEYCKYKV